MPRKRARRGVVASCVELTDQDGITHRLTIQAFEEGLRAASGKYTALCGRTILVAAMSSEPHAVCPECREKD
jgi:hypothetical protein